MPTTSEGAVVAPREVVAERRTKAVIVVLFFLSGACTLIFEIVWLRMLVLVFGMSVFAVSTVLTSFMAGLALGSAYFGRLADRRANPFKIYAFLELGIGLFALAFPFILSGLDELYTILYQHLPWGVYASHVIRFVLCFLVLLVPTTLMGGTLPVLSKVVVRSLSGAGRGVGGLYAVNTFGAATGCFAAAYLLMEAVGTLGTTYIAAAGNLLIALAALLLARGYREVRPTSGAWATEGAPTVPAAAGLPAYRIRLVFWGFALSGFTALGYEVVWTRLLCMVLGITTIQSVSTLLIVFLFGLAAGGAVAARWVDRWKRPDLVFGALELLLGLFGLASIAVIVGTPDLLRLIGPVYSWWGYILKLFVAALAVMGLPTFLMGMLFPIAGRIQILGLGKVGQGIGSVYAVNTSGAILGAFFSGFLLVPFLGTQRSVLLFAAINMAVGAALLTFRPSARPVTRLAVFGGWAVPILLLFVGLPSDLTTRAIAGAQPHSELVYHKEEVAGTVTVHQREEGVLLLQVNGAGEVPTDLESIQTFRLLGNLPLLAHPDPQDVLVIAFGGGITVAAVEQHRPRRLDCVEVVPGVFDAARYFSAYNNRVFERLDGSPIHVILDDGRNHVLRTRQQYDVVISDSTHPGTADSWVLYTEEFYRLCLRRLKQGGMLAQWLPVHGLTVDDYKTILRTFNRVFPHTTVWMTGQYSIMLGTSEPLRIDFDRLREGLQQSEVKANLAEVDLGDPVSLLATLALDEQTLPRYTGRGEINTDDRPYVSFNDRSRSGTQGGLPVRLSLLTFLSDRIDAHVVNAGSADRVKLGRRYQSRKHTLQGQIAWRLGDEENALRQLRRARLLDPDEREAQRTLLRIQGRPER